MLHKHGSELKCRCVRHSDTARICLQHALDMGQRLGHSQETPDTANSWSRHGGEFLKGCRESVV
ncbi:hypothetical protein GBA52_012667 [Prunus armeniaca]|nr:hypothetical protein GBA52_012667 [Prunus armeniaca]